MFPQKYLVEITSVRIISLAFQIVLLTVTRWCDQCKCDCKDNLSLSLSLSLWSCLDNVSRQNVSHLNKLRIMLFTVTSFYITLHKATILLKTVNLYQKTIQ